MVLRVAVLTLGVAIALMDIIPGSGRIFAGNDHSKEVVVGQDSLSSRFKASEREPLVLLRFLPDGKHVVTAAGSGALRIWDWASGHEEASLTDRSPFVAVTFSPDGRTMLAGHQDGCVSFWDLATRSQMKRWAAHSDFVYGIAIRPDGALAATGSDDGTVKLWELPSGNPVATLSGHESWVGGVAFSPDGALLLSACADSTLRIWDVATHAVVRVLRGHDLWVRAGAFVAQGTRVLSGGYDGDLRLWDVQTGAILRVMHDERGPVYSVTPIEDGTAMAVYAQAAVGIWDWEAGRVAHVFHTRTRGPQSTVCGDVSPDGRWAAAGERNGTIYVWDLRSNATGGS
jgi:WD40 repeat protein